MREWTKRMDDTHYVLGSVMGPHPFPTIVRDFQAIISKEIKEQLIEKEGTSAGCRDCLRRRRIQCHRNFLSFHP